MSDDVLCDCDYRHRAIGMTGAHSATCAVTKAAIAESVQGRCPDDGTCHHRCPASGPHCWRVHNAAPLSGVFTNNEWPASLRGEAETKRKDFPMSPSINDPMILTVDLRDVLGSGSRYGATGELEEYTLRDAIIETAADKLVAAMDAEVRTAVRERLDQVREIADAEIAAIVREALSKPIQQRRAWGEAVGEETTVLEIARQCLERFFQAPDKRESWSREKPTNLTGLIKDIIEQAMDKELRPAVQEARQTIHKTVITELTKQLGAALAK